MKNTIEKLDESAQYIKQKIKRNPQIGVILGSGLGDFSKNLRDKIEISYDEIPHLKKTTISGHQGKLIFGKIFNAEVIIMQGRIHAYEGHSLEDVVFPVRLLARLKIENIILTNAAGGINEKYTPSQLILINDYINFTGTGPLIGKNHDSIGTRFPDMSYPYDLNLQRIAKEVSEKISYKLQAGVYIGVQGPQYETPSEIKMFRSFGADLVGMSTVNETIAANHMRIPVLGISCVTNMAAGVLQDKLEHADIKERAQKALIPLSKILTGVITYLYP